MTELCSERVGGYGRGETSRPCGKPVERDGLCKRHLTLAAKRAEKNAEWNAEQKRGDELRSEAEEISAELGVEVRADYVAGRYTGRFIVPGEWLREQTWAWSLMANCRPLTSSMDDGGTFSAALAAVEEFGGVLEHPAHTKAWRTFGLPKPALRGWNIALHGRPGYATVVDQAAYGHPCHKWTWLYFVGPKPPHLDWREVHTGRTVRNDGGGGRDHRSRTPPAFRDVLLAMARSASTTGDCEAVATPKDALPADRLEKP